MMNIESNHKKSTAGAPMRSEPITRLGKIATFLPLVVLFLCVPLMIYWNQMRSLIWFLCALIPVANFISWSIVHKDYDSTKHKLGPVFVDLGMVITSVFMAAGVAWATYLVSFVLTMGYIR